MLTRSTLARAAAPVVSAFVACTSSYADPAPFSDPRKPTLDEIVAAIKREAKKGTIEIDQKELEQHVPKGFGKTKATGFAPDSGYSGWHTDEDAASQFPLPLPAYAKNVKCVVVKVSNEVKPAYIKAVQEASPPDTEIIFVSGEEDLLKVLPRASVLAIFSSHLSESLMDIANSTPSLRYIHFFDHDVEQSNAELAPRFIISNTSDSASKLLWNTAGESGLYLDRALEGFCTHLKCFCDGEAMPCRLDR